MDYKVEIYEIMAETGELSERSFVKITECISTLGYIISGEMSTLMFFTWFNDCHLVGCKKKKKIMNSHIVVVKSLTSQIM